MVYTNAHFVELKLKQMGFGLVEMMKNLIPVWFSREVEKLNAFCFV